MLLLGGFLLVSLTRVTVKRSTSSASPARGESERRVTAQGQSYKIWHGECRRFTHPFYEDAQCDAPSAGAHGRHPRYRAEEEADSTAFE